MKMRIHSVHYPLTALGPGVRLGIWVQGCTIACAGCMSKDTWSESPESRVTIDDLIDYCGRLISGPLHGITISGGEPFEQPDALAQLIERSRQLEAARGAVDVLVYSGFSEKRLRRDFSELVSRVDGIVAGPYVVARACADGWRGSTNQRMMMVSSLGRSRYPRWQLAASRTRPLQLLTANDSLRLIGIPAPGDLDRLTSVCSEHGVRLEDPAWI